MGFKDIRYKTSNWIIKREKDACFASSPNPPMGDSCCVLIRIYFIAHRCIITYLMYQQFLFFQQTCTWTLCVDFFYRKQGKKEWKHDSIHAYLSIHLAQSNIQLFQTPFLFQRMCRVKCKCNFKHGGVRVCVEKCNQLSWFLSFSRCHVYDDFVVDFFSVI